MPATPLLLLLLAALTPAERKLRASAAGLTGWANTADWSARAARGPAALAGRPDRGAARGGARKAAGAGAGNGYGRWRPHRRHPPPHRTGCAATGSGCRLVARLSRIPRPGPQRCYLPPITCHDEFWAVRDRRRRDKPGGVAFGFPVVRKLLVNQFAVAVVRRELIADCVTQLYQRGIAIIGGQSKNVLVDDAQKLSIAAARVRVRVGCGCQRQRRECCNDSRNRCREQFHVSMMRVAFGP
jgi:hypothetical protein